ncbi:MAG: MotA/TolQ/ExbB proton channel family protein [Mogibacterium sp.]|nr:MotA/TolQ/ExbB proton channel family protein [Mogibacterium sp.]
MSGAVKDILRVISSALQIPTIIILLILIGIAVFMLGSIIAEYFTDHRKLKTSIPLLIEDIQGSSSSKMYNIIDGAGILPRQKKALKYLIGKVSYPDDTREALARQLIAEEEARYRKITKVTDIIARIAPMFGLMGTLIPLGPGLIALGQGDTKTLSDSLLIAFDTTVAGLISGAISYIVSGIRKGWYDQYMTALETLMETILEEQSQARMRAYARLKESEAQKK